MTVDRETLHAAQQFFLQQHLILFARSGTYRLCFHMDVCAKHLESGYLRKAYFSEFLFPFWKTWNSEVECSIMGKKLSPPWAVMAKADLLNTLDFADLIECANRGKDALRIVCSEKADYYSKNITVNSNNYISWKEA